MCVEVHDGSIMERQSSKSPTLFLGYFDTQQVARLPQMCIENGHNCTLSAYSTNDTCTNARPYNIIIGILDSSDPKDKQKWNEDGCRTDRRDRRDYMHLLKDHLDDDKKQEVQVGHSSELPKEIEWDEVDDVVLRCLYMVVLKERG